MSDAKIAIIIAAIVTITALTYKGCASQSGFASRITGKPVELQAPSDCKRILNMGKTESTKFIVYENDRGEIVMKEYSDWGILQGQYVVTGYSTNGE